VSCQLWRSLLLRAPPRFNRQGCMEIPPCYKRDRRRALKPLKFRNLHKISETFRHKVPQVSKALTYTPGHKQRLLPCLGIAFGNPCRASDLAEWQSPGFVFAIGCGAADSTEPAKFPDCKKLFHGETFSW